MIKVCCQEIPADRISPLNLWRGLQEAWEEQTRIVLGMIGSAESETTHNEPDGNSTDNEPPLLEGVAQADEDSEERIIPTRQPSIVLRDSGRRPSSAI
jgi:hypothetical protein